ncbi:hypothetical protein ACI7BZ_07480 [Xanthobacter sp. AM11]|uniref:hypothetical protein n=1 Tax=Xanthobacter sp. AM11 TaxID=3380643 RepID=UPI0039BF9BE5
MVPRRFLSAVLVRLALAYLLVAQAVLGGAVAGLNAAPHVAAQAGTLCAGGTGSAPAGAGHDGLCCILGCGAGTAQPLLAAGRAVFVPPQAPALVARFECPAAAASGGLCASPFDATGPPRRA